LVGNKRLVATTKPLYLKKVVFLVKSIELECPLGRMLSK
jgi:hypothetical protein